MMTCRQLRKRIEEADIIIESYPLYFFGMPGQMKLFTDRLLSMMCTYRGQKPPENGESFHGIRNPKTGQKLVLISGCAYSESESVYDSLLKEYECICGKNGFTAILCPQLKTLIELGASSRLDRYLSKYEAAGKEFAATKHLSEETKQKLSKAPFSEAVYRICLIISGGSRRRAKSSPRQWTRILLRKTRRMRFDKDSCRFAWC